MSPIRTFASVLFLTVAILGCKSSDSASAASTQASLNDTPKAGDPVFGGRAPRACPSIRHAPNAAEAAVLLQCSTEGAFGTIEIFLTNVSVTMTNSRPFDIHQDQWAPAVDTRTTIYNMTGSGNYYTCSRIPDLPAGHNCTISKYTNNAGACWKTTTGDYRCGVQGSASGFDVNEPPPTTF